MAVPISGGLAYFRLSFFSVLHPHTGRDQRQPYHAEDQTVMLFPMVYVWGSSGLDGMIPAGTGIRAADSPPADNRPAVIHEYLPALS